MEPFHKKIQLLVNGRVVFIEVRKEHFQNFRVFCNSANHRIPAPVFRVKLKLPPSVM